MWGNGVSAAGAGWAFDSLASTGAFETVSDVGFATGTKIQFGIDQRSTASHNLSNAKFKDRTVNGTSTSSGRLSIAF